MQIIAGKRYPTVTDNGIYGFFQDYRFLSNFEPAPLELQGVHADGLLYPTSEHAYMALKTKDMDVRRFIAALPTPKDARNEGQLIELREDWSEFRPHAMLAAVHGKYHCNFHLFKRLVVETGHKYLEETNNWGDKYWGVVNGDGLNMLGKTHMHLRARMQDFPKDGAHW